MQNTRCGGRWRVRAVVDGITISGGGSYAVATDELYELAQALEWIRNESGAAKVILDALPGWTSPGEHFVTNADVGTAQWNCRQAAADLGWLEWEAGANAWSLRASAEAYGFADRAAASAIDQLAGMLGYGAGVMAPVLILHALNGIVLGLGVGFVALAATGGKPEDMPEVLAHWLSENRAVLNNSVTVELIRQAMMGTDEVAAGALKIPYSYSETAEALGLAGVSTSALMSIVMANKVGLFAETPVSVSKTSTVSTTSLPSGLADRIERLPDPKHNSHGEQVRIDRYQVPGQPDRFDVYIAGTVDFSPVSKGEPFDLTSNFSGMADLPAGSYRAVEQALREAGVARDNPIVFTGHSQGGLLAETLGHSGNYNTQGVLTIGAPPGNPATPATFPVIALEHTEDLVPVLPGRRTDLDTIVVRRSALADAPLPEDIFFPAHEKTEYAHTARLADQASSEILRDAITKINGISAGAGTVESTTWLATRQP